MKLSILGSTGSIGTQALEVAEAVPEIEIVGLTAHSNIELLESQARRFRPLAVAVMEEGSALKLQRTLAGEKIEVFYGMEGLEIIASLSSADMVLNSLVGNIGLMPTVKAIDAGKDIALANKETLVSAGELIMKRVREKQVALRPVDSEHSAIFQCLQGNSGNEVRKIHLTASGGPFKDKTKEELELVTVEDALKHPNWSMGRKITVDSATYMNKGLEVIEAKWLFNLSLEQIEVLVHPQSIIHSMVEFMDGSVMAQLGEPDMRTPIQYALTYPKRVEGPAHKIDFFTRNKLTFEPPDMEKFPCLRLAFDAVKTGGTMPAVLNGANEEAVDGFLKGRLCFTDIPRLIEMTMDAYTVKYDFDLEDALEADRWAREYLRKV